MLRRVGIALLSVSLAISIRSEALAQDADMPRDCLAIATQIQAETHVRFMRGKAVDTLISDPSLASELGSNSISMQCPPLALVPEPQPFYWYVVTVWGQGSDLFQDVLRSGGPSGHDPHRRETRDAEPSKPSMPSESIEGGVQDLGRANTKGNGEVSV